MPVIILFTLAFAVWLALIIFFKRNNKLSILKIFSCLILSFAIAFFVTLAYVKVDNAREKSIAEAAGFDHYGEYKLYSDQGFNTKADLLKHREEQREKARQEEERESIERRERILAKEDCKKDLQCWGDKHLSTAAVWCDDQIERLAKYDFKWTDGWLESKFNRFRWYDQDSLIITFIGDKLQFQNGYGAWEYHIYECDFNTKIDAVLGVRVKPGRL
jgi:hypothetical protein